MPKYTESDWNDQLTACGGDLSTNALINLLFGDEPKALWNDKVNQMHVMYDSMYNYLKSMFPMRVWNDWQGSDELGVTYHSPYIPFDASIFQRSMNVCNPASANECLTDYCTIPRGGITNLPAMEMYKTGFKTDRICIANIRTSSQARQIAEMFVKERFAADEQVMHIFFTMAVLRMLGHKTVLEGVNTSDGDVEYVANDNPYNPLQGGRFAYMQPLFPAAGDLNNILPLDLRFLDLYGSMLDESRDTNSIGTGPRGERIYEMWYSGDWYNTEVLNNEDYRAETKYTEKPILLPGHSNKDASVHVIGNFRMRQMSALPRFTESTEGGITLVQPMVNTPVDSGSRATFNYREYRNAPFQVAVMLGKDVGEILSRPTISTGIEGKPIQPITGGVNSEWVYRNDYDKDCNPELNMPYLQKRYEVGFKMKNPDAGRGFIYRAKKFRIRATQTCNLRPIFKITPTTQSCDITTIGCNPNNERLSNNIMDDSAGFRKVKCSAKFCGDSANLMYRLTVRRESIDSISPDQNPLQGCACGDTVTVFIGDADGDTVKQRNAVIQDYIRPNVVTPDPILIVKLASALTGAECIQSIGCKDSTPTVATVEFCNGHEDDDSIEEGTIKFGLDSPIPCNVGASVDIKYYTDADVLIDTIVGTIVSINPDTMTYVISSEDEDFACSIDETQAYIKISCSA